MDEDKLTHFDSTSFIVQLTSQREFFFLLLFILKGCFSLGQVLNEVQLI